MNKPLLTTLLISSLCSPLYSAHAETPLDINLIGRALLNAESPEGAAEIVAYQNNKKRIFANLKLTSAGVVNDNNLKSSYTIDLNKYTAGNANSISIAEKSGLAAVAMAANKTGEKGVIAFYDISKDIPLFIKNVEVGYLPDMVTFTPDETKVVVANEGEPSGDYLTVP